MNFKLIRRTSRNRLLLPYVAILSVITLVNLKSGPNPRRPPTLLPTPTKRTSPDRLLVFQVTKFNGFGAQFLRLIDAAAFAKELDRSLCFHRAKYWNYGCGVFQGWNCYFQGLQCETPVGCAELEDLTFEEAKRVKCLRISTDRSSRLAAQVLREMGDNGYKRASELGKQLWKVNGKTRGEMERIQGHLMRRLGGNYIGIHVRRGDKEREVEEVELTQYVETVQLLSKDGTPVFVASDDGRVVAKLSQKLPGRRVVALASVEARKGHSQGGWNKKWKGKYEDVVDLLVEVEMLANAMVFVGTFSSNLGRVVYVLRGGKSRDSGISLDDRWEPGVAWRTFGKRYCKGTYANRLYCQMEEIGAVGK
eukprot:GFKZ01003272.1.p1 GENE.GFKZ01003272.1~~GFKZ01003272.1.p1  ORF type:complete len:364 (+),score=50.12 GFKZ01003272.1:182-1273(+)